MVGQKPLHSLLLHNKELQSRVQATFFVCVFLIKGPIGNRKYLKIKVLDLEIDIYLLDNYSPISVTLTLTSLSNFRT